MTPVIRKNLAGVMFAFSSIAFPMFGAEDGTGLQTSVAVDAVGAFKVGKDSSAADSVEIREAEVMLYGPIDHIFDGRLSIAAHSEGGASLFEVHEATISSAKLLPHTSFRVGQYFLGIGRLNRFHRHDWPFISAPKVHQEFFDDEGVLDTGGEISFLVPLDFYLNITAGATNGWTYGHSHDGGEKPKQPTHYTRIGTFLEPADDIGIALGANYLGRKSYDGTRMSLFGFDGVAKWSTGNYNVFLIQSEVWQRQLQPEAGETDVTRGSYLYSQVGFSKNFFLGLRLDYYTVATLKDAAGNSVDNSEFTIVPNVTYKTSEFATFKVDYSHNISSQAGLDDQIDKVLRVQSTFILGAHPAHDF